MNTKWTTSFVVYPEHCNYMEIGGSPMVHGGDLLKIMDRSAAECVRRLLYDSTCHEARTVGVDGVKFHMGATLGDLIILDCNIVKLRVKQIVVKVEAILERRIESHKPDESAFSQNLMAEGKFSFCSFNYGKSYPHGLQLSCIN